MRLWEQVIARDLVQICGHHFLARGLGLRSLILDLGANKGEFAHEVQYRWGARCLSVEANLALCEAWTGRNKIINAAVADRPGTVELFLSENNESSTILSRSNVWNNASVQVPAITLDHILKMSHSNVADLVKIDIEGAEIEVLKKASETTLRSFQQISVEFHDFLLSGIAANDVEEIKRRLHALGFWSISFSRRNTDVLFINKDSGLVTQLEVQWLRHVVRNVRGGIRVVQRLFRHL